MKQFLSATVLTGALDVSASSVWLPTGGIAPPAPERNDYTELDVMKLFADYT
jgi:hypothetical protein